MRRAPGGPGAPVERPVPWVCRVRRRGRIAGLLLPPDAGLSLVLTHRGDLVAARSSRDLHRPSRIRLLGGCDRSHASRLAGDVVAVADHLGIERFFVAGISPYVVACAYEIPGRVIGAAVVGGPGPLDAPGVAESMLLSRRVGRSCSRCSRARRPPGSRSSPTPATIPRRSSSAAVPAFPRRIGGSSRIPKYEAC